jgi:hypothetical protein
MYMIQEQKQEDDTVSTIRVSTKLKSRLSVVKAKLTIKDGKERSMEELIQMLVDVYEASQSQSQKR